MIKETDLVFQLVTLNLCVVSGDTTGNAKIADQCCDKNFLRSLGDERTSCRGYISQKCQTPEYLESLKGTCPDWKLSQFLKNRVEPCKDEMDPNGMWIL